MPIPVKQTATIRKSGLKIANKTEKNMSGTYNVTIGISDAFLNNKGPWILIQHKGGGKGASILVNASETGRGRKLSKLYGRSKYFWQIFPLYICLICLDFSLVFPTCLFSPLSF